MFVCVVSLSQCSSRDLLYVKVQYSSRDLLYVKCFCVLSRCPSAVLEICYMLNVLCVLSRCPSAVVEICYMLNVCVCCLVIPVR